MFIQASSIKTQTNKYSNIYKSNNNNFFNIKNLFSNQFVENCQNYLTCEACLKKSDRCGWCYSDDLCKSGNSIGATSSYNFCPYEDWENKNCKKRNCNEFKNQLACITDENCFWCESFSEKYKYKKIETLNNKTNFNSVVLGICEENEYKYNRNCKIKYDINDFFKNPNFYKSKNSNKILNEEFKQTTTLDMYNFKNNNKYIATINDNSINTKDNLIKSSLVNNIDTNNKNNPEKGFLNYKEFLKNLKFYMILNNIELPSVYDSISNPAGIYEFQKKLIKENFSKEIAKNEKMPNYNKDITPLKNINLDVKNLYLTAENILSKDSKKEKIGISKKLALEQLIGMFIFNDIDPPIRKGNNFNMKEYKILEKIANEKWTEFLEGKKIKINDFKIILEYNKDDPESVEDISKTVEKVIFKYLKKIFLNKYT